MERYLILSLISIAIPLFGLAQRQISRPLINNQSSITNSHNTKICEVVDLGLPSGTRWATCNIGAKGVEEIGNYYSWGELKPKSSNKKGTYNLMEYDKNITGNAKYDVATATFGNGYVTPTKPDFEELINNCTKTYTKINGVKGTLFVGPNGNSIFLPLTGRKLSNVQDNIVGFYWTSTTANRTRFTRDNRDRGDSKPKPKPENTENGAYLFSHRDTGTYLYVNDRTQGNCIRPVKKH